MLRPSDLIIDAFIAFLRNKHTSTFPDADSSHARAVERTARMTLPRIARSDALFHDLDHALCVVQVGQDLLRGRMIRDGDVGSSDWAHLMAGLLCLGVGFCNDAVRGDTDRRRIINEQGDVIQLHPGETDGRLWPWAIERSILFVRDRLAADPVLDIEHLVQILLGGRFPPLKDAPEPTGLAGLARDAHVVGTLANPRFSMKLTPFFIEVGEAGIAPDLGFEDRTTFQANYAESFWNRFHPPVRHAMELLTYTGAGRERLATLRAHVLRQEHQLPEDLAIS